MFNAITTKINYKYAAHLAGEAHHEVSINKALNKLFNIFIELKARFK